MSTRTLTVRLLRKDRTPEDAFSESFVPGTARALATRPWYGVDGAVLYIGQIYSRPPSWTSFLQGRTDNLPTDLFSSGAGAALFLPVEGRILVACFGQVHIALDDDAFERQFGLKVALNAVPRGNLRTLDLATPDAVTFQRRVQASKDSDLQDFGVDMLRDLARVAGGTPANLNFARFVAGKDSLSITCSVEPETVHAKCQEILKTHSSTEYQKEFPWVDNMRTVTEIDTIERLDAKVLAAIKLLRKGKLSELHMTPPEIVDYTDGNELHYNGFGSHGTTFSSLSIDDYVEELNRCDFDGDMQEIRERHRIRTKRSGEEHYSDRWRVYDCLVFETTLGAGTGERHYVLFAGKWYGIKQKFKDDVENFFNSIDRVTIIGATTCMNEEALIADLAEHRKDLLKLDRQKINPSGVKYANLEPCDFFSKNGEFIHLKDGHSSGPISHLWAQGTVAAEALVSDAEFRKKLRGTVKSLGGGFETLLPLSTEKLARDTYKIVFGIMRKPYADGNMGLPFFSKVSLQGAVERIRQFGFPVAIELIQKPASDNKQGSSD